MSYALRNTLALGIVLLLTLLGGGYWTRVRMGGQLKELREVEARHRGRLNELNQRYRDCQAARITLEGLKTKWMALPKVLLKENSPASVFAYLNDLMTLDHSSIRFNFTFQREVKKADYAYGAYAIVGTGAFRDVYNLIWRIEHERPLVKIASIHIQEQEGKEQGRTWREMQFEMVLHVYHSRREMPVHEEGLAYDVRDPFVGYDPFYPLVQEELSPNTEGLIEIEGGRLEAMTASEVVVRGTKGKRATLRIGDRVYLGRLKAILPDAQRAVFVLNKGGIVKRVNLEMEKTVSEGRASQTEGLKVDKQTSASVKTVRFLGVKMARARETAQVMIRTTGSVPYRYFELDTPPRIVLDMEPAVYAWDQNALKVEDPLIREIRAGQFKLVPPVVRVVIELEDRVHYAITQREGRIVVDIRPTEAPPAIVGAAQ